MAYKLGLAGAVLAGLVPLIAYANVIDINLLADSIYIAEGGTKTKHPYGILAHYKKTTPRAACVNTIKHALRDFTDGDFIAFLGSRYCPIGSDTDNGTCKYWVNNVRRIYDIKIRLK